MPPEGIGGALFVKEGSVIATMEPQNYVMEKPHDYVIRVYPGKDCSFTLYEDDGFTYDYREGRYALTQFEVSNSQDDGFTFIVHPRQGTYAGAPDNGHNITENSIPAVHGMDEERDCTVLIASDRVVSVTLDGVEVPLKKENGNTSFTAPLKGRTDRPLIFDVRY